MKRCPYCGKVYSDETSVCATDGQPLQAVLPPQVPAPFPAPSADKQRIVDDEHIKLLSIFYFIMAGLTALGIGFLLLHYMIMRTVFLNPEIWKSQKNATPPPQEFFKLFVWFYVFFGLLFITAGVLNFLCGRFLRQKKHRTFCFVIGCLNCAQVPFGTALGIFTIMVLSRDSVRRAYESVEAERK